MNFIYYGFGLKIISNLPLIGLPMGICNRACKFPEVSLSVSINSQYISRGNSYAVFGEGDKFVLDFKEIMYEVWPNKINVTTKYQELFNSTFYNVPLSILLLLNDRVLLHSSAFINRDKLYPICAEKGMGKSTLLAYALFKGDKVFCDDTLPLAIFDNRLFALRGTSFIKLNSDSCERAGIKNFNQLNKNINNKAYVETKCDDSPILLDSLYFMSNAENDIEIIPITSEIAAKAAVYGNIVGISWFNDELHNRLRNSEIFRKLCSDIKLYKYNVIRQWDSLDADYLNLIAHFG